MKQVRVILGRSPVENQLWVAMAFVERTHVHFGGGNRSFGSGQECSSTYIIPPYAIGLGNVSLLQRKYAQQSIIVGDDGY